MTSPIETARTAAQPARHGWKPRIAWEIPRYEWVVAGLLVLLILALHEEFARNAGALWRDEVHSVNTAAAPTLGEMWQKIGYQPHPMLMTYVLRVWRALVSTSDTAARAYGVIVGLGVLAAMWWTARQLLGKRGLPLVTLLIFGLSPHNVRYADSVRPYGLGILLIVVATGAVWRYIRAGTTRHAVIALICSTLAVQCLYHNAFLLAALCLAGAVTCALRRRKQRALVILGIGFVAAISLIPYGRHLAFNQDWDLINKPGFNPKLIGTALFEAIASSAKGMLIIWLLLLCLGLYRAARHVRLDRVRRRRGLATLSRSDERDIDLGRFCGVLVVASLLMYALLIVGSGLLPGSWYYLPLLAFIAPAIDALVNLPGLPRNRRAAAVIRTTFAGMCAAALFPQMLEPVRARQSTMDLVVQKLNERVQDDDLIVVAPWYLGLPFGHYYHGKARWMTVPPLEDTSVHRFDLIKRAITQDDSDEPVINAIAQTLNSGKTVWIVGKLAVWPKPNEPVPTRQLAPNGPSGWYAPPYLALMEARVWQLIRSSASTAKEARVHPSDLRVYPLDDPLEDPQLTYFKQ